MMMAGHQEATRCCHQQATRHHHQQHHDVTINEYVSVYPSIYLLFASIASIASNYEQALLTICLVDDN